tara:strand:+ start:244 stop:444 length:201 start_codon:yes stop_codon:yes gene_type:complete
MSEFDIYKYESTDPKQTRNELSVTFSFDADTDLNKAEGYILSLLAEIDKGVEYSFDMWTMVSEDYS